MISKQGVFVFPSPEVFGLCAGSEFGLIFSTITCCSVFSEAPITVDEVAIKIV